jgi:hypothetical protein
MMLTLLLLLMAVAAADGFDGDVRELLLFVRGVRRAALRHRAAPTEGQAAGTRPTQAHLHDDQLLTLALPFPFRARRR